MSTRRPGSRVQTPTPAEPNGSDGRQQQEQRSSVVLGPNDRLVGQLYIEGDLRVSGNVEGTIEATGDIEIAGAGKLSGTVTTYNRLIVGGGASLIGGDVRVARLTVEDGATFTGNVSMGKAMPEARKPVAEAPPEPAPVLEPQPEAIEVITPIVVPEPTKKGKRR